MLRARCLYVRREALGKRSQGHMLPACSAQGKSHVQQVLTCISAVRTCTAHRSQGQPIKAACAALMLHDVAAAVSALHLGHEPEQAAMLCVALGKLAGLQDEQLDRVFEALAVKCEAAGRRQSASGTRQVRSSLPAQECLHTGS